MPSCCLHSILSFWERRNGRKILLCYLSSILVPQNIRFLLSAIYFCHLKHPIFLIRLENRSCQPFDRIIILLSLYILGQFVRASCRFLQYIEYKFLVTFIWKYAVAFLEKYKVANTSFLCCLFYSHMKMEFCKRMQRANHIFLVLG